MNDILTDKDINLSYKFGEQSENKESERKITFTESELFLFVQDIINSTVIPAINKAKEEAIEDCSQKITTLDNEKIKPFIKQASLRMCDLEDKDAELHDLIKDQDIALEKVGAKAKGDIPDLADADFTTMAVRVKITYSKLTRRGALCSRDIMKLCKVNHYSQALEIMDAVIDTYPDECYKGEGTFKGSKYWLTMNGFRGFQ